MGFPNPAAVAAVTTTKLKAFCSRVRSMSGLFLIHTTEKRSNTIYFYSISMN